MKNISPLRILFFAILFISFGEFGIFGYIANSLASGSCVSNSAQSMEYGWNINSMDVDMNILANGDVKVKEKINVNFENSKHGIYRVIPLLFEPGGEKYNRKNFSSVDIGGVNVNQDGQQAIYTSETRNGSACTSSLLAGEYNKELFVKIGDPDATIQGVHEYELSYTIKNALRDDKGYPELYWNAVGNGWGVNIDQANIQVRIDPSLQTQDGQSVCYSGLYGSTDTTSCDISTDEDGAHLFSATTIRPFHGVTIQVPLDPKSKSLIAANLTGSIDRSREYIFGKWYTLLAFLPFFYFLYAWNKNGRDPKTRGIVAPRFDAPESMSPAQTGIVLDQAVDSVDIASIIISIAQKGWMKIVFKEGKIFGFGEDYSFMKIENPKAKPLSEEEKTIFSGIFPSSAMGQEVSLSSLKNVFYPVIDESKLQLNNWAVANGYLKSTPGPLQSALIPGYVLFALFWFFGISNGSTVMIVFLVMSTILSIIVLFNYRFYTTKGKSAQEEILGLKMYMATAEKDRIEFHNAPEKSPELFERLLPFAMALGVVQIWADKFAGLDMQPPSWYVGPYTSFNAGVFASDLTKASNSFASTMSSIPSKSGGGSGGFSGGGGGGGGGGSW